MMKNSNAKKKIVIVEDELPMQKALYETFTRNGFNALCASDGKSGLSLILENKPDMIILDLLMPIMDGKAVLKELRADAWGKNAPVLILTNLSLDGTELVKTMVETSPEYYLIKSDWTLGEIVKKAQEIISRHEKRN